MLNFLIISAVFIVLMVAIRKPAVTKALSVLYVLNLAHFVYYAFKGQGSTELTYFSFDATALIMLGLLLIICIPAFVHSFLYLKHESYRTVPLYIGALTALLTSLVGVYLANNLIVLWIFMEATTLSVSVLIYHHRSSHALEASWKYVFVSSVGIALAYMGILFMGAIVSPSENFTLSFANLAVLSKDANPAYLSIAFLFMLIGFSVKMELFPMHTVGIDANTIAPPPVSAVMSTLMVNSGFVAIYRVLRVLDGSQVGAWASNVLIISGVLSVLIAATYLLKSNNLKRLFAYSTLENMGLVAVALGIGGVARYAAFVHIIVHTLVKASLFFQARQVHDVYNNYEISKMGGYFKLYPVGAIVLLLATLAIVAFPPSGLFVSELLIFKEMLAQGHWIMFSILVLVLLFCIYSIIQKVLSILYGKEHGNISQDSPSALLSLSQYLLIALAFGMFFWQSGFIVNLINEAIK